MVASLAIKASGGDENEMSGENEENRILAAKMAGGEEKA
jgi:hypothetical protein